MTHESERTFMDVVEEFLGSKYGPENVERNVYLPPTGRYADFYINGLLHDYAVEVENDWEATIKGVGQALLYAGHFSNCRPVVIVPEGHVDHPEVDILRQQVPILELPKE